MHTNFTKVKLHNNDLYFVGVCMSAINKVVVSCMCALCVQLYIQRKLTWRGSNLLKRAIQIGVIYVSLYTGMSRISDYKHHWSDVLSGFCIGTLFALMTVSAMTVMKRNVSWAVSSVWSRFSKDFHARALYRLVQ